MIGKTLSHYRILERLGGGAMGEVFLAEDSRLGRKVALKLLAPELARNEEALQRFQNEARAVAELSHPNLAAIYDLGEAEGRRFLVLEYVEGESLERRLKAGPLSLPEALELGRSLAKGLGHAHRRGLVHRDIKAANVMVTPDGDYKLLDFGLARRATDSELTRPGTAVGTVNTMSPEQARGEPADARSDLWSVGVVLYQALTGQMPFRGEALPAILNQILTAEPPPPSRLRPDLPPDLEGTILQLLQKDPERRVADADELLRNLSIVEGYESTLPLGSQMGVSAGGGRASRWLPWGAAALVIGALALVLIVRQDPGEAMTTTVEVEDEFGEVTERQVPTASFRKPLTLFPFDLEDDQESWISYAAHDLLVSDLSQDPYVTPWIPSLFMDEIRAEGHREPLNLPSQLQRKIARQSLDPWFLSGSLRREGDLYVAESVLHETESGREVARREFRAESLFALVDQISLRLRKDLQLPEGVIDQSPDLPIAEMSTHSEEALRLATQGQMALMIDNDYHRAVELLDQAVAVDPEYCTAHFVRGIVYMSLQQIEPAIEALDAAMENLYRVPERMRFAIKSVYYYSAKQDPEKALAVAEMWTTLHPEDVAAHQTLAQFYWVRDEKRAVIREYKRILEIDPGARELLQQIGDFYEQLGELEEAEIWYRRFAEEYPTEPRSQRALAGLYENMGRLEEASNMLEETLLLSPRDLPTQMLLAGIEQKLGRFDQAIARCESALDATDAPAQRADVYDHLSKLYEDRGQIRRAIQAVESHVEEGSRYLDPVSSALLQGLELDLYVLGGRDAYVDSTLVQLRQRYAGPYRGVASIADARVFLERGDADSASAHLDAVERYIENFRADVARPFLLRGRGRVAEMRGQYEEALDFFDQALALAPNSAPVRRMKARALRRLDRLDEAAALLDECQRLHPASPLTLLERARLRHAQGDLGKAFEALDRALEVWRDADPDYPRLLEARALREEWGRAG